jgi:hypothetical protein
MRMTKLTTTQQRRHPPPIGQSAERECPRWFHRRDRSRNFQTPWLGLRRRSVPQEAPSVCQAAQHHPRPSHQPDAMSPSKLPMMQAQTQPGLQLPWDLTTTGAHPGMLKRLRPWRAAAEPGQSQGGRLPVRPAARGRTVRGSLRRDARPRIQKMLQGRRGSGQAQQPALLRHPRPPREQAHRRGQPQWGRHPPLSYSTTRRKAPRSQRRLLPKCSAVCSFCAAAPK